MKHLRLIATFFRLGALNELQYRANFWFSLFNATISAALALGALGVVFGQTDTLGGWRPAEMLALLAVYFIISGLAGTFVVPSLSLFMADVRDGKLDYTLIKPVDAQLLVTIRRMEIWKLSDLVVGLILLVVALVLLGAAVGIGQASAFGLTLLCGAVIVYSFYLMLATLAFWFIKTENLLVIFGSFYQTGRWPIGIYPQFFRLVLTFLVPIAFAVTVPAQALTGRTEVEVVLGSVGVATLLFAAARWFWGYGTRHYSGASA